MFSIKIRFRFELKVDTNSNDNHTILRFKYIANILCFVTLSLFRTIVAKQITFNIKFKLD